MTIFSALVWWSAPAPAIEVGWHDHMYLQLGDGVALNQQKEPKSLSLVLMTSPTTTNNNGSFTETVTFAQHTYDMIKSLSVNASVSLDSLTFSGDVNVGFFGKQTFDANDLRFVYTAIKNYGTTVYSAVDFSPTNKSLIAGFQKNLQGAALHSDITTALGTHYVRGYESAAIVSVVYSFHYASASVKQQTTVSANASWDTGSFSAFVNSFFASSNTTTTMSYEFYSTDPYQLTTNLNLGSTGIIRSYQQFTNFVQQVEIYANAMSSARAKVTGYILDRVQTVPGYLTILGGYIPPPATNTDYTGFLQAYSALQATKQSLAPLLLQGNSLSWLNAQGRQVMAGQWNQVVNYLAAMKSIAAAHFTSGSPLNIPSEVASFLAGLNAIRLPEIIFMDSFLNGSYRCIIGRVDCGCTNLTAPVPFYHLAALYHQTNYYTDSSGDVLSSFVPIYYNSRDFETNQLTAHPSGTINTHLISLFSGALAPLWNCLTNANPDINGYFFIEQPDTQTANWSVEVDDLDAGGQAVPVDVRSFRDSSTLSVGCTLGPCQISTPLSQ